MIRSVLALDRSRETPSSSMDFINYLNDMRTGKNGGKKYAGRVAFHTRSKVYKEMDQCITTPSNNIIFDLDIRENWLVAAHGGLSASIYDLNSSYTYVSYWNKKGMTHPHRRPGRTYSLECVNWSVNRDFFTLTSDTPVLHIVDTVACTEVEAIQIPRVTKIFQHRPQPSNNSLIANATDQPGIPIIDARVGNISIVAGKHKGIKGSKSIAWSSVQETVIASVSSSDIYLWDIRMSAYPIKFFFGPAYSSEYVPEIQFIPGTHSFVCCGNNKRLHIVDALNLCRKSYECDFLKPASARCKFSVVGDSDPPLIFLPAGTNIWMLDLLNIKQVRVLTGHVCPVRTTVFNPFLNELYSISLDGNIVWGTPNAALSNDGGVRPFRRISSYMLYV